MDTLPSQLPSSRTERWALLDRFLERWFPKNDEPHGIDASALRATEKRLGVALPIAFREWYERYGARAEVWSLQDRLIVPAELEIEDGVLTFCVENQGCHYWGIRRRDLAIDDPPVVISDPDGRGKPWTVESPSVSTFALTFALMNAKWSRAARYRANGEAPPEAIVAIERTYRRFEIPDMRWPAPPTRFFLGEGVIVETHAEPWIWATARSASALEELDAVVRCAGLKEWESFEVDAG